MAAPIITVIGSLNTDLITRTSRVPAAGETLISQSFDTGSGGKGANQAVACARLSRWMLDAAGGGADINMIGAVGDDMFGRNLVDGLRDDWVNTESIKILQGQKTGVAVIIVEEQTGENRILMSPNANFSLKPEDFIILRDPVPDLIVLQLEIPLDTTLQILNTAAERNIAVLLNPAPAQVLPREAYAAVTHLIVNESEATIITGTTDQAPDWTNSGAHFERIIALGVRHVTITLGSRGVMYLDTQQQRLWQFPAEKVNVVDTTAAGDTFIGAYAVAAVKHVRSGDGMLSAVKWANSAAAKTVERQGAQAAIPWLDEVENYQEVSDGGFVSFDDLRARKT